MEKKSGSTENSLNRRRRWIFESSGKDALKSIGKTVLLPLGWAVEVVKMSAEWGGYLFLGMVGKLI